MTITSKRAGYVMEEKRILSVGYLNQFHKELERRMIVKQQAEEVHRLSCKFSDGFQEELLTGFGNTKVQAETVYMQYMLRKGSVHIFKTKWKTLEDFLKYKGRLGAFQVEYKDKTWYIQRFPNSDTENSRSPDLTLKSPENLNNVPRQCSLIKTSNVPPCLPKQTEDAGGQDLPKINSDDDSLSHQMSSQENNEQVWKCKRPRIQFKMSQRSSPYSRDSRSLKEHRSKSSKTKQPNRKSSLLALMEEEERVRERQNRKENWLREGIIVQIVSDSYGKKNNRRRCRIVGMVSQFTAVAYVMSTDEVLQVHQKHLRTCLPETGSLVRIVNGAYRDEMGVVERRWICESGKGKCCVRLTGSPLSGRLLKAVGYNDVSEMYQSLKEQ